MIRIEHLNFTINTKTILHDINLSIPRHKITAIIGPNGCGKSTLLKHLSGEIRSHKSVYINGQSLEQYTRMQLAREVAVLSQQYGEMTAELLARDVVLMGRYPYKHKFANYTAHDYDIVSQMLTQTGALPLADKPLKHLSGGERQRVFIAKALAQEPQLLLLDEPTNHLDVKYKLDLMKQLRSFEGTVAIVLHDLSLVKRYCDYVVLMEHGKIIAHGDTSSTLTSEALTSLFEIQFFSQIHEGKEYLYY